MEGTIRFITHFIESTPMRGMYISDTNRFIKKGLFGRAAFRITSFNIVLFLNQVFINKDHTKK